MEQSQACIISHILIAWMKTEGIIEDAVDENGQPMNVLHKPLMSEDVELQVSASAVSGGDGGEGEGGVGLYD